MAAPTTTAGRPRRWAAPLAALCSVSLLALAGCSDGLEEFDKDPAADLDCSEFKTYGSFKDTKVSIFSSIRDIEAERFQNSFVRFEVCTGIDIDWDGTGEFESDLTKMVSSGQAPDLAAIPQPNLIKTFVRQGAIKPPSGRVTQQAAVKFSPDWVRYGTVDDVFYAPPLGANVKSFVWYSPSLFTEHGWRPPDTWDELKDLTRTIEKTTDITPWCVGNFSPPKGDSTGWPGTDWIEDVLLRTSSTSVYDAWIDHRIPFNHRRIIEAFDETGSILRNPAYVNGGFGGVRTINEVSWQDAGQPILDEKCAMSRAASFYINQWPSGTRVERGGDVFAFYLPAKTLSYRPVLGGGEFLAAFNTRPETQAVQLYMISDEWINAKAKSGYWISPSKGLSLESVDNPIDKQSVKLLQDQRTVFRFDASDLMPQAVGSGSFWKGMYDWFEGRSTYDTLTFIESSWPVNADGTAQS